MQNARFFCPVCSANILALAWHFAARTTFCWYVWHLLSTWREQLSVLSVGLPTENGEPLGGGICHPPGVVHTLKSIEKKADLSSRMNFPARQ